MKPTIRIQNLEKAFGRKKVLRGLSFDAEPGRITAIAGPNASGKTTLIKSILGLVVPDSGEIFVGEMPVKDGSGYRRNLGYVPQMPDFPSNLVVKELLEMLEGLRRETAPRKTELVEFFELKAFFDQPFGQLSGGTKQKVAAVVALMFDAPILVMDEPTASLDPVSTVRIKDLLINEAARGKTILLASHAMAELDQLATELLYIMEGRIVFSGSIDYLKKSETENTLERAIIHLISNGTF